MGRTSVQVAQGDTLKTIAQRIYGNEALWYVLADANGLTLETPLAAGTTLTAPEVKTVTNDASTFRCLSILYALAIPDTPLNSTPDPGIGIDWRTWVVRPRSLRGMHGRGIHG